MIPSRLTLGLGLLVCGPLLARAQEGAPIIGAPESVVPSSNAKIKSPPSATGKPVFSILPRSFQANPTTDLSVICEMTDEGRKRPVVTPQSPATYLSHDAGFMEAGAVDDVNKPNEKALREGLARALAHNGFKPVAEGKAPDYALIIHWGTHTRQPDSDTIGDIISRAMLVGGRKFSKELADVLMQQSKLYEGTTQQQEDGSVLRVSRDIASESFTKAVGSNPFSQTEIGAAGETPSGAAASNFSSSITQALSPLEIFKRKSDRNRFLVDQCFGNIYFAVITALDPVALTKGKKVLLWRARMSVDAGGISLTDALPALLNNSAAFLGRDMDEVATMVPNIMRGKAETKIGEIQVLTDEEVEKQRKQKK